MDNLVRKNYDHALAKIQQDLLLMGWLVNGALESAIQSLKTKDEALAKKVITGDEKIDELQISIEDRTVELIALQQPIAKDLRILSTALKMTTDLERIGDHAKKIAKVSLRIGQDKLMKPLIDLPKAAEVVKSMVEKVLKSYVQLDTSLAEEVLEFDDTVDELCDICKHDILQYMIKDQSNITQGTDLLKIVSRIERIGDHATNLAEWVIYLVTGHRITSKNKEEI